MEFKGTIKGVTQDFVTGELQLTVTTTEVAKIKAEYDELVEIGDLKIKMEKWSEKRTNNANSYFHVLVDKIAKKVGISSARVKNEMIADYGFPEEQDGQIVTLTTIIPPEKMQELDYPHCKLDHYEYTDQELVVYILMRGSHTYSRSEMATLIQGTVQEAQDLGIQTATPAEMERMLDIWESQLSKKKKSVGSV